jgi:hypothetical protein
VKPLEKSYADLLSLVTRSKPHNLTEDIVVCQLLELSGACFYMKNTSESKGWKVSLKFTLENLCIRNMSPNENTVELELEPDGGVGYVLMKPIERGNRVSFEASFSSLQEM